MFAVAASQHKLRAGFVDKFCHANVVNCDLARAAAAAGAMGSGLAHSPRKRLNVNFVFVLMVLGFTFDSIEL
jgi:hypothetical protein